jgi:hypothetical protein
MAGRSGLGVLAGCRFLHGPQRGRGRAGVGSRQPDEPNPSRAQRHDIRAGLVRIVVLIVDVGDPALAVVLDPI